MAKIHFPAAVLFITLFYTVELFGSVLHTSFSADVETPGEFKSPGFPESCCSPVSFTIKMSGGERPAYIRLSFSDMDLPEGSLLQIFEGENATMETLLPTQPELRRGMWTRPELSTTKPGSALHVKFSPAETNETDEFNNVGFKGEFWVTNSPPDNWDDKALPDVCTPIINPIAGERVMHKSLGFADFRGRTVDCVWQLKLPRDAGLSSLKGNLKVYLRIDTFDNYRGYLDIKEGVSSAGKSLLSFDSFEGEDENSVAGLKQPTEGFTSGAGLYVHLTILNEGSGVIEFVYGYLHAQEDLLDLNLESFCPFGDWGSGFLCHHDNTTWCIPKENTCNLANNCPGGEDEDKKTVCTGITTTMPTIPKSTRNQSKPDEPEVACPPQENMCRDWSCGPGDCLDNGGQKCDGAVETWCPRQGCISMYRHEDCWNYCTKCPDGTCSLSNKCPGVCDKRKKTCPDGSCISSSKTCPGECSSHQHRCKDGTCVSYSLQCADTPCKYWYTKKCHDKKKCFSESDRCDGHAWCNDRSDEWNCVDKYANWLTWAPALMTFPILLAVTCYVYYACCRVKKRKGNTGEAEGETAEGIRMAPINTREPPAPAAETATEPPAYEDVTEDGATVSLIAPEPKPPSYESLSAIAPTV